MDYNILADLKILVIGDLMIDHYIHGNCNRISPEAPVPVVEIVKETYTLGGAGNVLQNLISLNCRSDVLAVIGDDDYGSIVKRELAAINIDGNGLIKDYERCTIIKSRVMVTNHQMIRLDREQVLPVNSIIQQKLLQYLEQCIASCNMVLISDYGKGLLTPNLLASIISICNTNGKQTIVDPKGNNFSKYNGVTIIKPNKKEAAIATGIPIVDDESLLAACKKIKQITNCENVIITMSEDGIALFDKNIIQVIPTKALDVIDVTGAGDTVLAALGVALASNNTLYTACNFANHAAAVVVSKVGSATATLDEIERKILN
jgi:rfaE bifunctional protein kinase chain/domain